MTILPISAEEYHADPCGTPSLSSSVASLLIARSPAHAKAAHPKLSPATVRTEAAHFDIGAAAHAILLEGDDRIVEVDAADWRTKAAKEERDAARAAGMTPLLIEQAERVREMVAAVRSQLAKSKEDPPLLSPAGKPEKTIVWTEGDRVQCRALIDWLHDDLSTVDDVKTTSGSASPEAWSRGSFFSFGYDIQAAFHSRGVRALSGRLPLFRYIVVETTPPFALSLFTPGADVLAVANAKVDFAIEEWRKCLSAKRWPAYPLRLATIELPPWEEPRWMEREGRDS